MRSETETIERKSTKEYRNDMTLHLVRITGNQEHMKESLTSVLIHLEKINGRLRYTENSISAIKAIGITVTSVLTIAIGLIGILR